MFDLPGIKLVATTTHPPGAVRLDGFPRLAHAPKQWGEGIRTDDNGTPIVDLIAAVLAGQTFKGAAARFNTTADHAREAFAYGLTHGLIEGD
jgi:hypothetical protein